MKTITRRVWRHNGHLDIEQIARDENGNFIWVVVTCNLRPAGLDLDADDKERIKQILRKDEPMIHIDPLPPTNRADWLKARKNELDEQIDSLRKQRDEFEYGSAGWDICDKEIDRLLAEKDALTAADGVPTDEEVIARRVEEVSE